MVLPEQPEVLGNVGPDSCREKRHAQPGRPMLSAVPISTPMPSPCTLGTARWFTHVHVALLE